MNLERVSRPRVRLVAGIELIGVTEVRLFLWFVAGATGLAIGTVIGILTAGAIL